ncbi:YicC/YloC family endoribonuclease [Microaceticoccus formicicus]|uniref:YicC/YloC family endoribonuclease n=1 Tax=Microaceticoccus formicicus TaxID=3118105 RepID=UPI003CD0456C|nr:YicC/YloC family endoribonuclease [Peptoniphilaceae bacterium AMB_02]
MIKSMTGYGRGSASNEIIGINADIKSVNNKYLDIQVKMPVYLMFLDEKIKNIIKRKISRGRVDVYIKDENTSESKSDVVVDKDIAKLMKDNLEMLMDHLGLDHKLKLEHILLNNEIIEFKPKELDLDLVEEVVCNAVSQAVDALYNMRLREGEALYIDLAENISYIEEKVKNIEKRAPFVIDEYREKLTEKVHALVDDHGEYEFEKLNSEVVFFAERSDINEELVRLKSHIAQFRENLETSSAIGRKLDFITQELNREINTISAKSSDVCITDDVIDVKVGIDKLKEQIQNIE